MANQVIFTMTGVGSNSEYTPFHEIFNAIKPYGHFTSGDETDGIFELYDNSKFVLNCSQFNGKMPKCISSSAQIVNSRLNGCLVFEGVDGVCEGSEIYVYDTELWCENGETFINGSALPGVVVTLEKTEIVGERFLNQDGLEVVKDWVKDELATKQDTLVSGTNIKTINNESLLGGGNIDIQGGIDLEIGTEKWYGTYKEDGVTYPVYSKVLKINALPATAGITNYPHGITGIKQILSVYGFGTNGFVLNAPRQNAQDNIAIYQVQKASGGNVAIEVGKDRSNMGAYVCLIYAKNN